MSRDWTLLARYDFDVAVLRYLTVMMMMMMMMIMMMMMTQIRLLMIDASKDPKFDDYASSRRTARQSTDFLDAMDISKQGKGRDIS